MRIVIVGAGVIGMLTAVQSVAAGHQVVLLDQGDIPCSEATSYDRHRTVRSLCMKEPAAATAGVRAHHAWVALQRLLDTRFYEQVGTLTVLPRDEVPRALVQLTTAGSQAHVLNPDELTVRYPHVEFPIGESAVFESLAGVLLADRVLTACAEWLRRHPAVELRPRSKAVRVDVDHPRVGLADGEVVSGEALLLAGGPWSRELLPSPAAAELVLYRQSMLYCDVPTLDAAAWAATPAMLSMGEDGCAWLVPPVADTPLKLSAASTCRAVDRVEERSTPAHWRDVLVKTFAEILPGFHEDWVVAARDGYYLARAATDGAMVARLGERVLSFAGCGGSSFKYAPVISRCLSEHLTGADVTPTGLRALDVGILPALYAASPEPEPESGAVSPVL